MFCAECYRFLALGKRVGSFSNVPFLGWIITFLVYKTLAAFVSIDPGRSMISIASTVLEFIFPFYLVSAYIKQPEFWPKLRRAFYAVAVLVCALALLEQLTHANPLIALLDGQELEFRAGLLRVRSTFFHPIALACFINLLMPFVLIDLFRATKATLKLGLLALSLLLVLVSVMTVSRIPLLMLAAEIGIVCVWWLRAQGRSLLLYGCCFGLVVTGALFTVVQSDSLSSQFEEVMNPNHIVQGRINEASSEFYRVALFRAVVDRLQGWRWITGVGSGTFHLADVESNYDGDDHVLTAPDSHYVKLLLEVGILGVILAATIGAKCLVLCWKAIRTEGDERQAPSVGAAAGIIAFLIINATVSMFDVFPLSILFWLDVAICWTELHRDDSSDHIGIDPTSLRLAGLRR
jgi:hypothetical protein